MVIDSYLSLSKKPEFLRKLIDGKISVTIYLISGNYVYGRILDYDKTFVTYTTDAAACLSNDVCQKYKCAIDHVEKIIPLKQSLAEKMLTDLLNDNLSVIQKAGFVIKQTLQKLFRKIK